MTAVAALGVYRAYRHTLHDRVRSYLGLYHAEDEEYEWVDDDQPEEFVSEPALAVERGPEPNATAQRLGVRESELAYKPSG